jgi:hypothetical protein
MRHLIFILLCVSQFANAQRAVRLNNNIVNTRTDGVVRIDVVYQAETPIDSLTIGLLGYWPFTGNANDESDNSNDGIVTGATLTTDLHGNSNSAYLFDGNDIISVPHDESLNTGSQFTYSFWINPTSTSGANSIIGKSVTNLSAGFLTRVNSGNLLTYVNVASSANDYNGIISNDEWKHVIVEQDEDGHINYYVDYFNQDFGSQTVGDPDNASGLTFGADSTQFGLANFEGVLDEFRLYDQVLTDGNKFRLYKPGYIEETITYSSSIDNISNLYSWVSYDSNIDTAAIVVVMHGWSQDADDFNQEVRRTFMDYGYFTIIPGMRGRNGASGTRDGSRRELYDIYDAIEYVKTNYANYVDETKIALIGYSGGGANVIGMAGKFPDLASITFDYFGITDYGYTDDGWYQQGNDVSSTFGGTPSTAPNNYYVADPISGVRNYYGDVYAFHDTLDVTVEVIHSQRLRDTLTANSIDGIVDVSFSGDPIRYLHGLPTTYTDIENKYATYKDYVHILPELSVNNQDVFLVQGFLKTKDFEIWLDDGLSEVATLDYNLTTHSYSIDTSSTGSISNISITEGALNWTGDILGDTTIILE